MSTTGQSEDVLRTEIVEICRRMHQQGLIAGSDGNVSARLRGNALLTTPAGAHKGYLRPDELVKTDVDGRPLGRGRPSSELRLHLLAYQLRPDVQAAIHAHPPHAVALSLAGISLAGCLLPETVLSLGSVPTARYATPTTEEVPESVRHLLGSAEAIILARHGTLTLGANLQQAFFRLESLEHTARITALARAIGPVEPLAPQEQDRLAALAHQLGISRPHGTGCTACGTCRPRETTVQATVSAGGGGGGGSSSSGLVEAITARVLQRLGGTD